MVYAEGFLITLVALGLWALGERRWVLAGVAGALATATSPVALAFERQLSVGGRGPHPPGSGSWRALVAPALVPVGFVGYQLWLWRHTGNIGAWKLTERGGWSSYLSLGYPLHVAWRSSPIVEHGQHGRDRGRDSGGRGGARRWPSVTVSRRPCFSTGSPWPPWPCSRHRWGCDRASFSTPFRSWSLSASACKVGGSVSPSSSPPWPWWP